MSAPTVTFEQIQDILERSIVNTYTVHEKCTIVTCLLPNGFVLVESSGAVSKENYNVEIGHNVCMQKIADQIWKMEGYKLASVVSADAPVDAPEPEPEDGLAWPSIPEPQAE